MEVVPYFLTVMITVVAVYWSARQYRRKPGAPISGLFRYHEVLESSRVSAKARAERVRPATPRAWRR